MDALFTLMIYPKSKKEITKIVLSQIPSCRWHTYAVDTVVFHWWTTGRSGSGLRLTEEGSEAFNAASIEYYEYPLGYDLKHTVKPEIFAKEIGDKVTCPYYLGVQVQKNRIKKIVPYIRLYDDKVAMLLSIYGNLKEYMDSFTNRIKQ